MSYSAKPFLAIVRLLLICLSLFCLAQRSSLAQITELPHQSASLEGSIQSSYLGPGTSTVLTFYNVLADPINVYWLDYNGKRVSVATLKTGEVHSELTYFTHPFLITDANDAGLFIVIPESAAPSAAGWRATAYPSTTDVTLPAVDFVANMQYAYHGDPLPLTFTETFPSDPYVLFGATSNKGTLLGTFLVDYFFTFNFDSSTTATVSVLFPGDFSSLPARQYSSGVIVNDCLLNGPFDSSHYYFQWDSPGFDTSVTFLGLPASILRRLAAHPMTYWVDLNNLNLSPENTSADDIIQGAEAYIHTELNEYYVLPLIFGAAPLPSNATKVTASHTVYNKAQGLSTVTITATNFSNQTFEGPIQVVIADLPPAIQTNIVPSPRTFLGDPYFTKDIPALLPGTSVSITFSYLGTPQTLSYTLQAYSGTFLTSSLLK